MLKWFNNLKVNVKILGGYLVVLVLLILVSGLAIFRFNQVNALVNDLATNLLADQYLADQIDTQIWEARFHANRYIRTLNENDLSNYQQEYGEFDSLLAQAEQEITASKRVEILRRIKTQVSDYGDAFDEIAALIETRNNTVDQILDIQGPLAEEKLNKLRHTIIEEEGAAQDHLASIYAGDAQRALLLMRLDAFKYLEEGKDEWATNFEARYAEAVAAFETLDEQLQGHDSAMQDLADEAKAAITKYHSGFKSIQEGYNRQNDLTTNKLDVIGANIFSAVEEMTISLTEDAVAEAQQSNQLVLQTRAILIGAVLVAIVISFGLGFFISNNITGALREVAIAATGIADGELTQSVNIESEDEIGEMATAFRRMIAYLQSMARVAGKIAQGDLTEVITPKSAQDVLGNAFINMTGSLRNLIDQTQQSAAQVADTSDQLNATAAQTGQASEQVAQIIQQVAQGTSEQTRGVTEATGNVEQIARASDGIARGAQEQAESVQRTSALMSEVADLIADVGEIAQSVAAAAEKVTQTALAGVNTVDQTNRGIATVQTRTSETAFKIKEMSERSREIGRIVETIDDIADKTDMLALNAAVEAARAGEHGRGFAVVADQVRKLSEDSKTATRDIAELIERVQEAVREAIAAVEAANKEVDTSTELAENTVQALENIQNATESSAMLTAQITEAVAQVQRKSEGVIAAMESMSAVVEENTAAAEEMSASSREVMESMEGVASIAEENSAATEEVSASTEEMSAQVEEMVASAQELAAMAQELREAVARFQV